MRATMTTPPTAPPAMAPTFVPEPLCGVAELDGSEDWGREVLAVVDVELLEALVDREDCEDEALCPAGLPVVDGPAVPYEMTPSAP